MARPPERGRVLAGGSVAGSFTLQDLRRGRVAYSHGGGGDADAFRLTVRAKDARADLGVSVLVASEGRRPHAQALSGRTLVVEEGKLVRLSRARLQVGGCRLHPAPPLPKPQGTASSCRLRTPALCLLLSRYLE